MQFEDSTGCLWTEEQDDDGYVYYVNANTMVRCQYFGLVVYKSWSPAHSL